MITKEKVEELAQNEPEYLVNHRKTSFELIQSLPDPTFRHGLSILLKPEFDFNNIDVAKQSAIAVDGAVHCHEYTAHTEDFLSWKKPENKVDAFNQAAITEVCSVTIPKDTDAGVVHININPEQNHVSELHIVAESNTKATILIKKSGSAAYMSSTVKILTQSNANITIVTLQSTSEKTTLIEKHLSKGAGRVEWVELSLGSQYNKQDIIATLDKEGAEVENTVLYFAKNNQKFDIYTASVHAAPHTSSNIVTRGAINEKAKALSRGLVRIEKNAPNSNGYEQQDALLLSSEGEADAIPNLEIHNHDVKCSHGSTVGQVDEDKLFYLMSRGLSEQQAKQKIVEGYFTPVLELFKDETLKSQIAEEIEKALTA